MNERGFVLLNVVFLTLIVSLGALILLNANVKVQQRDSTLRLTAINLANEQFAEIESLATEKPLASNYDFLGEPEDLISYNGVSEDDEPVKFTVRTIVAGEGNLREVKVTVKWRDGSDKNTIELKKIVRVFNSD